MDSDTLRDEILGGLLGSCFFERCWWEYRGYVGES
jgi:hypothetical protein